MRGFLIFLAFAFLVVLASPFFWSLVNMETGAERVGYVQHDGVTQWATLGPKAPWPSWAIVPQGAHFTVQSNFEAAPGHSAIGRGEFETDDPPQALARRYEGALASAGWRVTTWRFDALSPDVPPSPMRLCIIEGRLKGRVQRLSLDIADAHAGGAIQWTAGPLPPLKGARAEPCWRSV
jgi:hypothetical protein